MPWFYIEGRVTSQYFVAETVEADDEESAKREFINMVHEDSYMEDPLIEIFLVEPEPDE